MFLAGRAHAQDCHDLDTSEDNERCTNYMKERK